MGDLFTTGIRPAIDKFLQAEADQVRDYGNYWSASSAGYCMRRNTFERLKIPHVHDDPRTQRVFSSGHIFHEWIQRITKKAGLSVGQEIDITDDDLMVRGHIDDIVFVDDKPILYDYKTQNSRAFSYQRGLSYFHKMQVGTYMHMLRKLPHHESLSEARILKISKDDLRMHEEQLLYTPELEKEILKYWKDLNGYWKKFNLPPCTCADKEGGFMAQEKYNPFFYEGEPCSAKWYEKHLTKVKE